MSVLTISLPAGGDGAAGLDGLIDSATESYARSLACPIEQVCVLVDYAMPGEGSPTPRMDFLVPEGTPLAAGDDQVSALKRRLGEIADAMATAIAIDKAMEIVAVSAGERIH